MTQCVDSSVVPTEPIADQSEPNPPTWLEPLSLTYRKKRALIALLAGLGIALAIAAVQIYNGAPLDAYWVDALPVAIGLYRSKVWMARTEIRRYAQMEIHLTKNERVRAAWKWWAFGLAIAIALWTTQYATGHLASDWLYPLLPSVPLILVGMGLYLRKTDVLMTKEGKAEFDAREAERQKESSAWVEGLGALIGMPIIRYPAAAGLLWLAYTWGEDPKAKSIHVIAAIALALFAARELAKWLLVAGLVIGGYTLLFNGLAALPVSVAVIIGALIIASAVKN